MVLAFVTTTAMTASTRRRVEPVEGEAPVIQGKRSLFHNHTARNAGPTRRILCRRVRQILIVKLMDDEGAPILIE